MSKENVTEVISFRMAQKDFKKYEKQIRKSKMKPSKFFREILISKSDKITLIQEEKADHSRLLFLANKTSNNVNQIAKRLNNAYRGGVVSEETFKDILNRLITLENSFVRQLDKC